MLLKPFLQKRSSLGNVLIPFWYPLKVILAYTANLVAFEITRIPQTNYFVRDIAPRHLCLFSKYECGKMNMKFYKIHCFAGTYTDEHEVLSLPIKAIETLLSQPCDSREVLLDQLKDFLQLDEASLEQPDPRTKQLARYLADKAKQSNRIDLVKELREITPAGTTGESVAVVL